jgi:hypothetical protein
MLAIISEATKCYMKTQFYITDYEDCISASVIVMVSPA